MKRSTRAILTLAWLIVAACGPSVREEPDSGSPCAQGLTLCYDAQGNPECVSLPANPNHCGSCGHECRGSEANGCVAGLCACVGANGNVSDECGDSTIRGETVCVRETGQCIVPNHGSSETCDEIEGIPCPEPEAGEPDTVCAESWCTVPDCSSPETCDGLDNDCDGHVDAVGPHPGQSEPLSRECYSGDPAEIGVGECRPGVQKCYVGSWTPQDSCPGQVLPIPEDGLLACDGRDNDCNDCVDDQWVDGALQCGLPSPTDMDVVFGIDISGSMSDNISAARDSVVGLEPTYGATPYIEWALQAISASTPTLIEVLNPLTDFATFKPRIVALSANGGGTEPTYDSVWLTLTGMLDPQLGLGPTKPWDLPIVVIMTDEQAQSLMGLTEADVCQAVADSGAVLAVFTDPIFFMQWDDCAYVYPLSDVAATMTEQIDDLFEQVCAPMSMSMVKEWNWRRRLPLWLHRLADVLSGHSVPQDEPVMSVP